MLSILKRIYSDGVQGSEDFYSILIGDTADGQCDIISCIRSTYYKETTGEERTFSDGPDWLKEITEVCTLIPTGKARLFDLQTFWYACKHLYNTLVNVNHHIL